MTTPNNKTIQQHLALITILAVTSFAHQANANSAFAAQDGIDTPSYNFQLTETPGQGSASVGYSNASYNLSEGTLRASIDPTTTVTSSSFTSFASASLSDTLTFNFDDSSPQIVEWSFHLTGFYDETAAEAIGDAFIFRFSLSVDSDNHISTHEEVFANLDAFGVAQTYDQVFSGNYLLNSGDEIDFSMSLDLDTFQGVIDFSNTAALQLTLPAGTTFTSQQGLLTAVPVPSAILLMLSGLLSIGSIRSFKKK